MNQSGYFSCYKLSPKSIINNLFSGISLGFQELGEFLSPYSPSALVDSSMRVLRELFLRVMRRLVHLEQRVDVSSLFWLSSWPREAPGDWIRSGLQRESATPDLWVDSLMKFPPCGLLTAGCALWTCDGFSGVCSYFPRCLVASAVSARLSSAVSPLSQLVVACCCFLLPAGICSVALRSPLLFGCSVVGFSIFSLLMRWIVQRG